ncbi:acyl-CoA dehydratase activase [Eubacterium oxidoreducens]|uniref:CoA-substrate-specific enzyme activase, putative n=1 Tax=Eubacterium oxidoreducens TaxID=1732 RepID=A0A1G6BFU7_EUBOX|nr:acyl-CoA dehydratase activase [Eubacterium oxidoreducens]SDB19464.1 CoA-substrate-specific enzyme activase, putative [Eubacterium oxidoreducens]
MNYVGIDIGSTSAKVVVLDEKKEIVEKFILPTGLSSVDVSQQILQRLEKNYSSGTYKCVSTGYGRAVVGYAEKNITEITCHAKGAVFLFGLEELATIDIGGQDTKVIEIRQGNVVDFVMNDKCSAGTGRFLEIMGNAMQLRPDEVCEIARSGGGVTISSMCTVFAESEVISLVGSGEKLENIAYAIVDSIADKVATQAAGLVKTVSDIVLTGGLCECGYLIERLQDKLSNKIKTHPDARFAGAIGAAISAFGL